MKVIAWVGIEIKNNDHYHYS